MWSCWVIASLLICLFTKTLSHSFETEDVTPVRLTGRTGGRVARRSEEQPSFRLAAFGRNFTLNLTPDSTFISPALGVYRLKAKPQTSFSNLTDLYKSLNQSEDSWSDLTDCFYTGAVDFNQDSVVSVSLCHGVLGSFITDGNEYLIEPKRKGLWKYGKLTEQLHVIKRRRFTKSRHVFEPLSDIREDQEQLMYDKDMMPSRRKRFVSAPRFIETLVVADASLTHFYGDEIKHYLLTLMSVAAQIYKHPSIKNSINIVLVKMLIVEDEEVGPSVSSNGGVTLRNFCAWQQLFNPPSHRHPEHYDTAILFTREDICGHQSCDTMGVADVGTMCDSKRSCSVIEDNGLQAAFTTAHELGHVLSMPHDDAKNCEQLFGHLGEDHVMAPVFTQLRKTSPWSPCSALYVTEFFDNGYGDCLLDTPDKMVALPTELPGVTYGLDRQCQQLFGEEFSHCPNASAGEVCRQLWCQQEGQSVCTTRNGRLPWADGTGCAPNRTCLNGICISSEEVMKPKAAVDGGWGEWGPWQPCSRTCGGGVMFSYRECNHPSPQNGGKYCLGQRVNYQSCNTHACENNRGKSFREEQCEKYKHPRNFDVNGNVKQWIPKYAGVSLRDRCKLFCRARGSSEFRVFESKVIDGTPCSPDTTSFCVQGQCIKAGCDLEIDSSKKMDKCGMCGGNGLSCRMISGSFNKEVHGYRDIVTIPSGATYINIKQQSHGSMPHDGHYLAIRRESGEYILNGNFSVSTVEQYIPVLGAVLKYSGSSSTLERIQSFRQLQEPITIQLLSTAGESIPPKVKYTFYIPKSMSFNKPKEKKPAGKFIHPFGIPQWVTGEWSECSKTCGSGWSRRNVECKDNAGYYSNHCNKDLRPSDIRPCADLPCPMWQIGPWSSCSLTCGYGERNRNVLCIDYTGKTVEPETCDPSKMPDSVSEKCLYQEC
ncbi:A disintegrin and metalloproteinase with thrombospondin motifs 8 [Triplophysa tibetana]|uniref:A disintegrin and metalloproteinase with thrombospondin motifs 8 n=1 Tax=Triplophysa tibetana TaxID=1572043 RepID=A0A5A9MYD0_9TELE|nr:A disintegrin and metalloproteinase with thrombospondin motifs 8 [Triplophysa tibetana]